MLQLCNLRRFHMIGEVANFYPIEIVGGPSIIAGVMGNPSEYVSFYLVGCRVEIVEIPFYLGVNNLRVVVVGK